MTAAYDDAEVERLIQEAQRCKWCKGTGSSGPQGCFTCLYCEGTKTQSSAMADQLEAARDIIAGLSPESFQALVDENDRMRRAFNEAIGILQAGGSVRSGFCCWCGQHWPHLDGESYETFRKYTIDHAETCPAHNIRIERDAARARIAELEDSVQRTAPVVAAADAWRGAAGDDLPEDATHLDVRLTDAVDTFRAKDGGQQR